MNRHQTNVETRLSSQKYDKTSPDSILQYAKNLTGKSLSQVVEISHIKENTKNRGDLGLLIEKYYFEHSPGPVTGPDFPEAGVELKTTGLIKKSDGTLRPKERLVLKMIDFETIIDEEWETSSLYKKCKLMLLMFYLYDKNLPVYDRKFVLDPLLYEIPANDLEQIRADWEVIREKVRAGKAHELSEGDTFYLGACRKGSGGDSEKLRKQPKSDVLAKSRAFSFKPNYLNLVINGHGVQVDELGIASSKTFEQLTLERFEPYIGKSIDEISQAFGLVKQSRNHKGFHRQIAVRILSAGASSVLELEKADIEMKTIRLQRNGRPKEPMSFPGFKFTEILSQEWEDSSFFERIERKFLFVVFQTGPDGIERLNRIGYWNMPYSDRLEAQRVWEETKARVAIDATNLPRQSESDVAHVRPKGRDGKDKLLTPQGGMYLKQCFWLNRSYVATAVKNL